MNKKHAFYDNGNRCSCPSFENEVVQKLQADQGPNVQKVVNDLIVAKKITLLFNSQALLAYDRTNPLINITPEVIELLNQANSKD